MDTVLDIGVRDLRTYMLLIGVFGAVAVSLASTGIYGVMAYSVSQRSREIGIRMAVGGRRADVMRLILGDAARIILAGLALGLPSALALTRVFQSFLFEVAPTDLTTYAAVSILLICVAAAACVFPARRAAAVDPTIALKYE